MDFELKIKQKAQHSARAIIKRFGTNDPFQIAAQSGVAIVYESWYPTTIGEFEERAKRILVNEQALGNNQNAADLKRAIVAHELGHFFWLELKIGKLGEELFAREFARELLK